MHFSALYALAFLIPAFAAPVPGAKLAEVADDKPPPPVSMLRMVLTLGSAALLRCLPGFASANAATGSSGYPGYPGRAQRPRAAVSASYFGSGSFTVSSTVGFDPSGLAATSNGNGLSPSAVSMNLSTLPPPPPRR
ncbi:hypothetical protein K488DRAFT_82464 [Vararia minispora EC-137]|uniref:Uncharacterized protein n=1 Tax=Vararia minispora EC-137 TaxID=1314806 RepID=A0ACB8QVU0_9AGAM|nr:hypothetical protein K488DRAFT_82464 [Vararia minispora EC-137]